MVLYWSAMDKAEHNKRFTIRARAVIMHEDELLVVKHAHDTSYAALPGGHLDWGEDPREALRREVIEELGITPILGRLLYVNTYLNRPTIQPVEFFIEVTNGKEFKDTEKFTGSHSYEIAEVLWVKPDTEVVIRPEGFAKDFREGKLIRDEARFING